MLGLVHRTVLGVGPPQFRHWFFQVATSGSRLTRRASGLHDKQLYDYLSGEHSELLRRSALGLPRVYNSLPQHVVNCKSVRLFQKALQGLVKRAAKGGEDGWQTKYSTRETKVLTQVVRRRAEWGNKRSNTL